MSTDKGFLGWGPKHADDCVMSRAFINTTQITDPIECTCKPKKGDEGLLGYLYEHQHMTPFEMCGMVIEVKAPIFVFREWHRHRTQSYNEMSARYVPLPDENYVPSTERIVAGADKAGANRQAQGTKQLQAHALGDWLADLAHAYDVAQAVYERGLEIGVPKELARLPVPVARYSKMRASANLRNWLAFLTLRDAPTAQWEIRQYAACVGSLVQELFPRTWMLFSLHRTAQDAKPQ